MKVVVSAEITMPQAKDPPAALAAIRRALEANGFQVRFTEISPSPSETHRKGSGKA